MIDRAKFSNRNRDQDSEYRCFVVPVGNCAGPKARLEIDESGGGTI